VSYISKGSYCMSQHPRQCTATDRAGKRSCPSSRALLGFTPGNVFRNETSAHTFLRTQT